MLHVSLVEGSLIFMFAGFYLKIKWRFVLNKFKVMRRICVVPIYVAIIPVYLETVNTIENIFKARTHLMPL